MDWHYIKQQNKRRSARKAKRERIESAEKARISAAGGPVKVGELRAATRRTDAVDTRVSNIPNLVSVDVWFLRGREWLVGWLPGGECAALCPFAGRPYPDLREGVPLTSGALAFLIRDANDAVQS